MSKDYLTFEGFLFNLPGKHKNSQWTKLKRVPKNIGMVFAVI